MAKVIRLTESELTNLVKKVIKENQQEMELQQITTEFNEKAEEDLDPEEFKEVVCADPDSMDVPQDTSNDDKKKFNEFKAKLKTASIADLKQAKRQLRELKRQGKQQQNEQATMVTLLGVTMPHGFALFISGIMLIMVLNILLKLFNIHLVRSITYWCTGRRSTGFGIGFGRN